MDQATLPLKRPTTMTKAPTPDEATFGELYDYYLPRVFNYVVYRVGHPQVAEDLTATVFERALRKMPAYKRDRGAFSTWLFTVACNLVVDHLRKQGRAEVVSLEALPGVAAVGTPEAQVLRQDELARLHACVASLPEREQEIVALKFAAALPNERIAQVMGLSAGNVGVVLYRAIQRLRRARCFWARRLTFLYETGQELHVGPLAINRLLVAHLQGLEDVGQT